MGWRTSEKRKRKKRTKKMKKKKKMKIEIEGIRSEGREWLTGCGGA